MIRKLGLALAAIGALAFAPLSASAQYYYQQQNNNDQVVGGLVGAGLGAVIGSQVSGSGARTEGSVVGALVGGLAGAAIADNRGGQRYYASNGGYYQQPRYQNRTYYNTQPSYGYSQPRVAYQQPRVVYQQPRVVYQQPYYGYQQPYYRPRTNLTINLGNGGYRNQGYYGGNRHYRPRRRNYRRH